MNLVDTWQDRPAAVEDSGGVRVCPRPTLSDARAVNTPSPFLGQFVAITVAWRYGLDRNDGLRSFLEPRELEFR